MAPTPMTTRPMSAATTIPAIFSARISIRARYEKSPAPRVGDSLQVAKPRRFPPFGHTVPRSQNAASFSFFIKRRGSPTVDSHYCELRQGDGATPLYARHTFEGAFRLRAPNRIKSRD